MNLVAKTIGKLTLIYVLKYSLNLREFIKTALAYSTNHELVFENSAVKSTLLRGGRPQSGQIFTVFIFSLA